MIKILKQNTINTYEDTQHATPTNFLQKKIKPLKFYNYNQYDTWLIHFVNKRLENVYTEKHN